MHAWAQHVCNPLEDVLCNTLPSFCLHAFPPTDSCGPHTPFMHACLQRLAVAVHHHYRRVLHEEARQQRAQQQGAASRVAPAADSLGAAFSSRSPGPPSAHADLPQREVQSSAKPVFSSQGYSPSGEAR